MIVLPRRLGALREVRLDLELGVVVVELVVDELEDLVRLRGVGGERVHRVGLGGPPDVELPVVLPLPPPPEGAGFVVFAAFVHAARSAGRPPAAAAPNAVAEELPSGESSGIFGRRLHLSPRSDATTATGAGHPYPGSYSGSAPCGRIVLASASARAPVLSYTLCVVYGDVSPRGRCRASSRTAPRRRRRAPRAGRAFRARRSGPGRTRRRSPQSPPWTAGVRS